jgi:hypothetical protein
LHEIEEVRMTYEYEHRPPTPTGDGVAKVADLYVVRDGSKRITPSHEFLAAVERLTAPARSVIRCLIDVGFESLVRK